MDTMEVGDGKEEGIRAVGSSERLSDNDEKDCYPLHHQIGNQIPPPSCSSNTPGRNAINCCSSITLTQHQNKQKPKIGRKHDLRCGNTVSSNNNSAPSDSTQTVISSFPTVLSVSKNISLEKISKTMSPNAIEENTQKIKKVKRIRLRTRKISMLLANNNQKRNSGTVESGSPTVEDQSNEREDDKNVSSQQVLQQDDSEQERTNELIETSMNENNNEEEIRIDSSTRLDVFLIMFLVGMYASQKYGANNQTQDSRDLKHS